MIRAFNGHRPKIADSAFVSEWAYVVGDVEIGENSGVFPGAVIRADFGAIRIGSNCLIEDNCVLHSGADLVIGDNVIIGHGAVVHCARVGDNVLIGNNATVLDYTEIGNNCVVGANSMVSSGLKIPDNSFAVGVPARVKKELAPAVMERWRARRYEMLAAEDRPRLRYPDMIRKYKAEGL